MGRYSLALQAHLRNMFEVGHGMADGIDFLIFTDFDSIAHKHPCCMGAAESSLSHIRQSSMRCVRCQPMKGI